MEQQSGTVCVGNQYGMATMYNKGTSYTLCRPSSHQGGFHRDGKDPTAIAHSIPLRVD